MNKEIAVGIADMKFTRMEGRLITYALGSCVGVCLYDPIAKVGAMVHIMLPQRLENSADANVYKFADTGIRATIKKMEVFGAVKRRLTAKIAGGAKMFDIPGGGSLGNIGQRNIESVRNTLREEGIPIVSEEVGGNFARTLVFDCSNGQGNIRSFGRKEIIF
ncbi:chemotaxis protein CheD [Anaerotignum sp.]|uniref:chemotaxis protein CheD n=1 Tax=Anaerotignum sp. TaxID=2039241 RepID=UPI00289FE74E|nr:chemotaxis protein CheD [Anaerotignum sp.]